MSVVNNLIVSFAQVLPKPVVKIFAKKYIAGDYLQDAVRVVRSLNEKGILATIDVLGEAIRTREEAVVSKNNCLEVLNAIEKNGLNANLSIKPTQFGYGIDREFGIDIISQVVETAERMNNFVRLDMEDSSTTDATFELLKCLKKKYKNVGVVVQAYLRRTRDDIYQLNSAGDNFRLCKGIYVEPESVAYKERQKIRDNYLELLRIMFEKGAYAGIATHDEYLIEGALSLISEMKIPGDKYEFQMLYGVREDLRDKINARGHKIRIYVPFGIQWYKYSVRRMQENPHLAWYITKSIFTFK